ncbi:hypothetical protein ZOSMA_55G00610 [Zostera marina]|uniref:MYND-type domain-containing protein n=1 Tax=Zostera marina TaxID=29655 RepID=A0A0K9NW59_ZOSMR|nr:hypothetical protein ZOSMA_55G00610 [Zostera marina]
MEDVKRLVSEDLRQAIFKSTPDLLVITCTSLIDRLLPSARFQQVVRELAYPEMGLRRKTPEIALQHKCQGNHHFSNRDYAQALKSYSQALRFSPVDCDGVGKKLLAMIYANRASSFLELGHFEACVRDCSRAIDVSSHYVKAWYRRGRANALLKNYEDAVRDFETAFNLQDSISEKQHIKKELDTISSLFKKTITSKNMKRHDDIETLGGCIVSEPCSAILECITTKTKGRGMVSLCDVFPSSMVHYEEPLAAVVLKSCRENHCHFCFTELGGDVIFCPFCATPFYCSEHCREKADLEHRHECKGVNWPVIFPSDAILAGRIVANFIEKGGSFFGSKPIETSDFSHNYVHESPERKLELHIYSVVLLYCLNYYYGSRIPFSGTSASQT